MPVLTLTVFLSGALYMMLILYFYRGLKKLKKLNSSGKKFNTKISLVIPVRNEAQNIPGLIRSISGQDYPARLLEVIFVDDHSEDNSFQLISDHIGSRENFHIINSEGNGKKPALQTGFKKATGKLIITTDADCCHSSRWISAFAGYYEKYRPKFIAGPVVLAGNNNLFQSFQQLEFLSLAASTAGSFGAGNPVMCNGANMAFEKVILANGKEGMNHDFSSGDDMFLLQYVKEFYPGQSDYIRSSDAIVTTAGQPDLSSFIKQRIRWTSKSSGYRDIDIKVGGIIVLLINFLLLWTLATTFFLPSVFLIFLFLYVVKTLPDFLLVFSFSSFYKIKTKLWFIPLLQVFYPFYIVFTSLGSINRNFEWKGRYYNK